MGLKLERNPNWKGGVTITSHGYRKIKKPDHPNVDVSGYIYEHRLVVEKEIGRYLKKEEIVHHKDGNRLNNDIKNLELCKNIAYHKFSHRKHSNRQKPDEINIFIECACGCKQRHYKYDKYKRLRKFIKGHRIKKEKYNEEIKCACGCGIIIKKYDKYGRSRKYISGHNNKGRKRCQIKQR